jgi:arylsulfate sulfotransferase
VQYYLNQIYKLAKITTQYLTLLSVCSILLFSLGCDENNNLLDSDGSSGGSSGIEADTTAPNFTSEPVVTMAPNPNTPLAGLLELETDEPTTVSVAVTENTTAMNSLNRSVFDSSTIEFDDLSIEHSLPLLGFTPGGSFTLQITVSDAFGNQTEFNQQLFINTDPLPEDFPPIEVTTSNPEKMEPGVTLFDVSGNGANGSFGRAIVAVNESGEVLWYHKPPGGVSDVRMLPNGNLLFINDPQVRTEILEIDMLGNTIRRWHAALSSEGSPESIPVDTLSFHHEVFVLDNGNFLVLSIEFREFEDYPSSETDPEAPLASAVVAGDPVVEFSPDGTIVGEWSLLDMLDPFRIAYGSLGGFWNNQFPEFTEGTKDWSHGNAVIHDSTDNTIIVSLRHQDAVVKFSRETGELIWILGTHDNWDPFLFGDVLLNPPDESFKWQYHQHAPELTPDGNILLFDNGNFRASPFDDKLPPSENFSRVVEFSVDETTMEISEVWEYGEFLNETIYATFLGDADYMSETGNILITFGGITLDAEGIKTDSVPTSKKSARIIEVTHTTPAEKVFDLSIEDSTPETLNGWTIYRSERLHSLYPEQ